MDAMLDWTHFGEDARKKEPPAAIKIPRARRFAVRKGGYSFRRATRLSRLGLAGSFLSDVRTGIVLGGTLFAVNGAFSYFSSRLQGERSASSLKKALDHGWRQGTTEFSVYLLAAQAAKSWIGEINLEKSRDLLAAFLEPQTAAVWASSTVGTPRWTAAGYLSSTLIAGLSVVAVLTAKEALDFLRKRLSKGQALKNIIILVVGNALEIAGWFFGGVAGAKMGMSLYAQNPVWGGRIGALAGSVLMGVGLGFLGVNGIRNAIDPWIGEDAGALVPIFDDVLDRLAAAHELSAFKRQQVLKRLERAMTLHKFRDMYASPDKYLFAENVLNQLLAEELEQPRGSRLEIII